MKVINSTNFTIKVNSNILLTGQEVDFPLGEGERVFISSDGGISTVELCGATLKEVSTGDLAVNTVGSSMLIVNVKS